ncbi:hypothetical protein FBU30_003206 [Linnemannia zychae]|nr:hypothetical protein FBU30_003206 [Linnemannia zychae]
MDSRSSNRGDTFADNYSSSTSVAAAAPESSTLAVKLSEDPEGQIQQTGHDHTTGSETKSHSQDHRHSLKEPDQDSHTNTQALRRSRSGRLLRSTVQYDERDIHSSSPDLGPKNTYDESHGSSFPSQNTRSNHQDRPGQNENSSSGRSNSFTSPQEAQSPQPQTEGGDNDGGNRSDLRQYRDENMDEIMSEEGQDEDGSGEDAEDGNNEEGSESIDTNSSKNDDGSDNLVVSMYGSPSLVKVRMYGFHKIYRYDREESTMNRRNPESQRWQFYHPDFQRDRPHLRSNIKRKSARSMNVAPTFSRVMFDEKGPYIQQDYQTRPFNGLGGHNRSQSSNHPQDPSRHGHHMHGGHQGHGHFPFQSSMGHPHRQPHLDPSQRPSGPRHMGDYRQGPSNHPSDTMQRDDKDLQHHYATPHQRQHSYAGPGSQGPYSPDHPYGPKPQGSPYGYSPVHGPNHGHHHPGQGPSHPTSGHGRPDSQGQGHSPSREGGYPDQGHDSKQGPMASGGHFRSQSAPGLDPRRVEAVSRQPHPFSHHEPSRSPPHGSVQAHGSREIFGMHSHPSHSQASHRHQGSVDDNATQKLPPPPSVGFEGGHPSTNEENLMSHRGPHTKHPLSPMEHSQSHPGGPEHPSPPHSHYPLNEQHRRNQPPVPGSGSGPIEKEDPNRRLSPSQAAITGGRPSLPILSPSSSQRQLVPIDHSHNNSDPLPGAHGIDPTLHPNPQDLVPRTIKQLESRLFYVEDAYMSLRQFAQDLQNVQISQEQTIAWMRERIEQLSEAGTPRGDSITSPSMMHGGIVPSKRKADYSPGDTREWGRRGPEHQPQGGYSSLGPPGPGSVPHPSTTGPVGNNGRYETSGFHPSQQSPPQQQPQASPHPPHHDSIII